ncbi:MAG: hypothetical protein GPJ07_08215 [Microcystis aeruginosa G13-07]|nr:hypothetical protein [Microcystis aeruginosa G13-07]
MVKNWAIIIGINQYSFLENLNCAKADAEKIHCWLGNNEGGKFDRLFLFTEDSPPISANPLICTQPTFGHLRTFFNQQFKRQLLTSADNLWFFFSGHGNRGTGGDYLMLSDSDPGDIESTALSVNYITERLRKWGAGNVVMFIDACRNEGQGGKGDVMDMRNYQGIITFYSCSIRERSYEIQELGQGAFTYVLLKALQEGKSECLTVGKLERYLIEQVPSLNHRYGKPSQRPLASVQPIGKSNLILLGKPLSAEIDELKLAAHRAKTDNPEFAKQLWIQVNIAAHGRDADAVSALTNIVLADREKDLLQLAQPLNDISQLKLNAFQAQSEHNLELARELWIKVNIATKGTDIEAIEVLAKLSSSKSPLPEPPAPPNSNYPQLSDFLAAQKWREADQETMKILLEVAEREEEGWLLSRNIQKLPCSVLSEINQLWVTHSNEQFGFSIQRQIWRSLRGQPGQFDFIVFRKFSEKVGWYKNNDWLKKYDNFTFTLAAPKGHLPSLRFPGVEKGNNCWQPWKESFEEFLPRIETCLFQLNNRSKL